ncbi:hypothetical protein ILUMI_19101, partial [Ignelater luminosus]
MDRTEADIAVTDTLKLPVTILSKLGFFPKNKSKRVLIKIIYLTVLPAYFLVTVLQFMNMERDMSQYADNLEIVIAGVQILRKVMTLIYREEDFKELIKEMKDLWNPNECDESTKAEINSVYNIVLRLQRFSISVSLTAAAVALVSPLFGKPLPAGVWTFEGHNVLYYFMFVVSGLYVVFAGFCCTSFDCIYAGFCAEIIVQFKILCYRLKHLAADDGNIQENELNYSVKMRKYINQHKRLLKFVDQFQSLYSTIMLVQYTTVCSLCCIELYAAME